MPSGSSSFYVPRRPEDVFAYVSDLERAPEWTPDMIAMKKTTPGPIGVGTEYIETVQVDDKREDAALRVTHYDPPRIFAHEGRGDVASFTGRFALEPEHEGTRVHHEYTVKMLGCFWILTPFAGGFVRKNTAAGLVRLRQILTAGDSSDQP